MEIVGCPTVGWAWTLLGSRKMLENGDESHLSSAPWNDGERSFFTKERHSVYIKNVRKVTIFKKKDPFFAISG